MLHKDLDIVRLIKMLRGYSILYRVLFTNQSRFLLNLNRRNYINLNGSDDPSSEDNIFELEKQIPKE